jgi:hypothetical protein
LNKKQKERLGQLAADGMDPMGRPPSMPVRLDVDFHPPTVARSIYVEQ